MRAGLLIIFSVIVLFAILKLTGIWEFIISEEIVSEKIYIKTMKSPDSTSQISLLLHVDDASHDAFTRIYIVPGFIGDQELPKENNCLKFPDSTGVSLEWVSNDHLRIYCSKGPEINTFSSEGIKIELIVSREKIDDLEKEGREVIWDEIENG